MYKKNIILFIFSFLLSQFDWQDNGLPLRQGIHIEWQRTGDYGSNGEMVFAWSDTRYGGRDIYAQKIDSLGNKLWGSEGTPIVVAPGRQEDPILVTDDNGGAYIIWVDYREEPDNGDIYGQHVDAEGNISWGIEGVILTNVIGKQASPNMCSDGVGGAFVIWNDLSVNTLGHTYGTHLTTVESEIIVQGTGVPIIANNSDHSNVSIEKAQQGSAVLVWTDDRNIDVTDLDIFSQRIDAQCNTLWSTPEEGGIPLCQADGNQQYSKVTYYNENESVVVWEDHRNNSNSGDVFIQYVNMNGEILLDTLGQAVCTNEANQIKPRVKADNLGAYIVWEDNRNGPGDIFVQRNIINQGNQFEINGKGICNASNSQDQPRLSIDGNGGAYIVWMDERYAPFPETEIFIQHVNSDGSVSFDVNGLAVCEENHYQFNPLVRNDGNGDAFVVWGDARSGSIGLYTQIISPNNETLLEVGGLELYFGIDGNGLNANSLYLGNNQNLLYWEDHRLGVFADLTYGQKIYSGWENIVEPNGVKLSDNLYQTNPKATNLGENIFLGFGEAYGDITLYYQLLNNQLVMQGNSQGNPVYESGTPQNNFVLELNNQNDLFFIFSDQRNFIDHDIYVQKYNNSGTALFPEPILIVDNYFIDDNVKYLASDHENGILIAYDSGDFSGTRAYVTHIDENSQVTENYIGGLRLSTYESDQFIKGLVKTNSGFFIIWVDQRSGASDIYGQQLDFNGNILGPVEGLEIATHANDQQAPSITYNVADQKILVCWEDFRNGVDFNIYCSEIDEYNLTTLELELCLSEGNQKTPHTFATLDGSYLFSWEDSRGSITTNIYYQSMTNNNFNHTNNGIVLCDADFNQFNPKIDLYDESTNSYIIYWDDMRSSGKEDLKNIYLQSVSITPSLCTAYDVNNDGIVNVIDVVLLVAIALGDIVPNELQLCAGDSNLDGVINVIDIVSLVNYIIS